MSTPTITPVQPNISPEVQEFAEREGVAAYLSKLIALAQQAYPTATRFDVFTERDEEVADDWYIVFELDAPLNLEQFKVAKDLWYSGLRRICPGPLRHLFCHSVRLP